MSTTITSDRPRTDVPWQAPAAPAVDVDASAVDAVAVDVAATPAAPAPRTMPRLLWPVVVVAAVGATVASVVGFGLSYRALATAAEGWGFGEWGSKAFPIGIDGAILGFYAYHLYLVWKRMPKPLLLAAAHLMTAVTIALNVVAAAGPRTSLWDAFAADPGRLISHGAMPIVFVITVETVRHQISRTARLEVGAVGDGVPASRWVLSPVRSARLFRQMKLWETTYAEAVALEQEREVYRVLLDKEFAAVGGWRKAPSDKRLPFKLAKYGLGVDEALARPQEAAEAERLRKEREAEAAEAAELAAEQRAQAREITRLKGRGEVEQTRHLVDAQTGSAQAQALATRAEAEARAEAQARAARRALTAAERLAEDEAEAEETARAAAHRKKAAQDELAAAQAREAAAQSAGRAAELEARAAEDAAAVERATTAKKQAESDRAAAERRAAEDKLSAVQAREAAARIELRAVGLEDEAGLTARARAVRKTARLIITEADWDHTRLPLSAIRTRLGVSESTASEYRLEAADLIRGGYTLPA